MNTNSQHFLKQLAFRIKKKDDLQARLLRKRRTTMISMSCHALNPSLICPIAMPNKWMRHGSWPWSCHYVVALVVVVATSILISTGNWSSCCLPKKFFYARKTAEIPAQVDIYVDEFSRANHEWFAMETDPEKFLFYSSKGKKSAFWNIVSIFLLYCFSLFEKKSKISIFDFRYFFSAFLFQCQF